MEKNGSSLCTTSFESLIEGKPCQISDFGLAKLMPQDLDLDTTTRVLGTFRYFDPEYALVSDKQCTVL
jgi:hypothetical protein